MSQDIVDTTMFGGGGCLLSLATSSTQSSWRAKARPTWLHKNRRVQLLVAGPDVRIVTDDGQLLRALTLDPTRGYQPLGGRWPVHNVLQQVSTMS